MQARLKLNVMQLKSGFRIALRMNESLLPKPLPYATLAEPRPRRIIRSLYHTCLEYWRHGRMRRLVASGLDSSTGWSNVALPHQGNHKDVDLTVYSIDTARQSRTPVAPLLNHKYASYSKNAGLLDHTGRIRWDDLQNKNQPLPCFGGCLSSLSCIERSRSVVQCPINGNSGCGKLGAIGLFVDLA